MAEQTRARDSGGEQVVEELRLLLEALVTRAQDYLRVPPGNGEQSSEGPCRWCPLCAAAGLACAQPTELSTRLVESLVGVLSGLRQALDAEDKRGPEGDSESRDAENEPGSVQRIAVRHVSGSVAGPGVESGESGC